MGAATFHENANTDSFDPAEFVYVDTACGDVNRRNKIHRFDQIHVEGKSECYASYQRSDERLVAWVRHHKNGKGKPTVEGFDGPLWTPYLPLDFDCDGDLPVALGWLRQTLARLDAHGVELRALRVYFSGGRGFHLEVPHALLGQFEPSPDLPARLKRAAAQLLQNIPFDSSIYDRLRLWRLPNTRHGKTGLFKVQLTIGEVMSLDFNAIRALARQPRDPGAVPELTPVPDDDWLPVAELVDVWERAATVPSGPMFGAAGAPREPSDEERKRQASAAIAASWPHPSPGETAGEHVSRHTNFLLPVAGFLARYLTPQEIEAMLCGAVERANDRTFIDGRDWQAEVKRLAADSARKRMRGDPVVGLPTLRRLFPALADVLGALWPSPASADPDEVDPVPAGDELVLPYIERNGALYWGKPMKDGTLDVMLANFVARIIADVRIDDGAEMRRLLEIEATVRGRHGRFTLSAERFQAMAWPVEYCGAGAILSPGIALRDHARAAIQALSTDVRERTIYGHLGWREIDGQHIYLHAGGGIGADGAVDGVDVQLAPPLDRFLLPDPPTGDDLAESVRASLAILEVAPDEVTAPVLGMVYRAPLGSADHTGHLAGPTGVFKTALAALAQQHQGATMDGRRLPASWISTSNANETLAFLAKDALLVVDDFAPTGTSYDVQKLHLAWDRLTRGQGNGSGRGRLGADASLKAARSPRGLLLSTGEDVGRGQSARARVFIIEVERGMVFLDRLTKLQEAAADGQLAGAFAAYVKWLARHYARVPQWVRDDVISLRARALRDPAHGRTPEIIGNLATGWRHWLSFGVDVGAITTEEAHALWARVWRALTNVGNQQADHQAASEPTARYIELLAGAIASKRAHVADREGNAPANPGAWGWTRKVRRRGPDDEVWLPGGRRVGWTDGADLFLDPDAAYAVVQELGKDTGDPLTIGEKTLAKRLRERGLLVVADRTRKRNTVREPLEGRPRRPVLHLRASVLDEDLSESAQPSHRPMGAKHVEVPIWTPVTSGPISWADSSAKTTESAHDNGPDVQTDQEMDAVPGPEGTIGPIPTREEVTTKRTPWRCSSCRVLEKEELPNGRLRCLGCGVKTDREGRAL
jgi:hypothetical protein